MPLSSHITISCLQTSPLISSSRGDCIRCNRRTGFELLAVGKVTSFSRKPALSAIWFSFMRRASRDRFAAMLFFLRRAQYLSSFKSSGTNCGRKRKIERKTQRVDRERKKKKRRKNVRTSVSNCIARKYLASREFHLSRRSVDWKIESARRE